MNLERNQLVKSNLFHHQSRFSTTPLASQLRLVQCRRPYLIQTAPNALVVVGVCVSLGLPPPLFL
jgi:hypothetical protein